jgi:hypothetical protein
LGGGLRTLREYSGSQKIKVHEDKGRGGRNVYLVEEFFNTNLNKNEIPNFFENLN